MKTNAKIREHRAALVAAHQASTTPAETVDTLVAQIGQESAAYIIAAMVNAKGDWDGRISSTVRAWAAADEIPTRQQLDDACVWYCDEIHPAHMDQIARAMMAYQPAQPAQPAPEQEEETVNTFDRTAAFIKARRVRSAWDKGVTAYALELLDSVKELAAYEGRVPVSVAELKEYALNGARDWEQYSYGGSALIYDCDIAERLCCPSELKRVKGGDRDPNPRETWLDTQARALNQAFARLLHAWRFARAYEED